MCVHVCVFMHDHPTSYYAHGLSDDTLNKGSNQELIVSLGGLSALIPLLKNTDSETVTAAVAALRNLSIHKGNEVSKT